MANKKDLHSLSINKNIQEKGRTKGTKGEKGAKAGAKVQRVIE